MSKVREALRALAPDRPADVERYWDEFFALYLDAGSTAPGEGDRDLVENAAKHIEKANEMLRRIASPRIAAELGVDDDLRAALAGAPAKMLGHRLKRGAKSKLDLHAAADFAVKAHTALKGKAGRSNPALIALFEAIRDEMEIESDSEHSSENYLREALKRRALAGVNSE
ncbi:MAG TPA: hypothetical protein VNQ34_07245 [Xanthobacteraceae bacterium]|nr:hypothetical protein [Xanthobacteraceae bacterium]